jgi:hypothetical protein
MLYSNFLLRKETSILILDRILIFTNLIIVYVLSSAFSNPHSMHQYPRQLQSNRSQWQQGSSHDQQGFQPPMNDWAKQQQYRGTSKAPPPPHPSFGGGGGGGGYRPYM